jgi:hypothetical protein
MASPGIGRQHVASCTDAPSLPSTNTTPAPANRRPGIAAQRQRHRVGLDAALSIICASRLATMMAILRPRPMSTSSSPRLRLPLQRVSCCHSAAAGASAGSAEASAGPRRAAPGPAAFAQRARLLLLHGSSGSAGSWSARGRCARSSASRVGPGAGRGDDLDHVAARSSVRSATGSPLTLAGHRVVADVGVDGIGEVHRRGPARQRQDLALGREHVDRVGYRSILTCSRNSAASRVSSWMSSSDCSHIAPRRCGLRPLPFLPALSPPCRASARRCPSRPPRAWLGAIWNSTAVPSGLTSVVCRRLVAVGLGDGDVVLEAPRHRLVQLVQHTQRQVALGQRGHDDAEAEDVVDLREAGVLLAHLAVDRIERLLAARDLHLDLLRPRRPSPRPCCTRSTMSRR